MEGSGNFSLLSKFTGLRKKPQQPLTDLTELYGKIANESIYYLKLEERKNYKGALQGWKAMSTDILYRLTVIEHEHPNIQSYTREETNIKSGVRELYHKSMKHLERLKDLYDEEQEKNKNATSRTSSMHSKSTQNNRSSSFNRKPPMFRGGSSGSGRKLATTLRDSNAKSSKPFNYPSTADSRPSSSPTHSTNKVNFTPSKPLIKLEPVSFEEEDTFEGFNQDFELIDLTQDSEEDGEIKEEETLSPKSDQFEFDVDDYYGDFLEESASEDEDTEINRLEKNITNLSINSPPLIPTNVSAPEIASPPLSDVIKNRPPIPTNLPPSLICQPLPPTDAPPIPKIKFSRSTNGEIRSNSPSNSTQLLYKSKSNSLATASSLKKTKSTPKAIPTANLKATRSSPALSTRQPTGSSSSTASAAKIRKTKDVRAETASTAAKRVLVPKSNQSRSMNSNKISQRAEIGPKSNPKKQQQQPQKTTSVKRPIAAKRKRDANLALPNRRVLINGNGKSNSINSIISGSSSSSTSSSMTQQNNKPTSASEPALLADGAPEDLDVDEKQLKEVLEDEIIESLHGVDKAAAKQIFAEIVVHGDEVHWEDIAGLESAKSSLKEAVVYPFLRPDLFRGLREPVRGMLLFGPPGTGKTMLARAVATESHSTFFSISASSLTSKYLGESEKLVRALFAVAKKLSPSIVFVDEIDSIMGSRDNEGENESSRRIKNEFLIQWSSLSSAAAGNSNEEDDERVLVLAATNLPWSIDEAARRRFVRRQYIPLPEPETRSAQLKKLLSYQKHTVTDEDFLELLTLTEGFSGSDLTSLAKDAAMGPLRELGEKLLSTPTDQIRPIALIDFKNSLNHIKPSVSQEGLEKYEDWAAKFGSVAG